MHVDNELVECVPAGEQEYEEIIGEYEEEILIQEGALEPSVADFVDTPPAQGKPRCITLIFEWSLDIYIYDMYLRCRNFMEITCIHIPTYESS